MSKETNHSTSELRIQELEAGYIKHDELLDIFTKQLNELRTKQVKNFR